MGPSKGGEVSRHSRPRRGWGCRGDTVVIGYEPDKQWALQRVGARDWEESGMTLLSVVSWSLEDYLATWDTLGSKHS